MYPNSFSFSGSASTSSLERLILPADARSIYYQPKKRRRRSMKSGPNGKWLICKEKANMVHQTE